MVGGSVESSRSTVSRPIPNRLHVLRFEFVPYDRLRKAMTAGWPGESAAAPSSRR